MKKNRSNKYTTGICNTFRDSELRVLFFELDREHLIYEPEIHKLYKDNELDYLVHRTGSMGLHFLSPTLMTKERWKEIMRCYKHINPKCPMTTLRVKPNKYPDEDGIWYRVHENIVWYCPFCLFSCKYFEVLDTDENRKQSLAPHLYLVHEKILTRRT